MTHHKSPDRQDKRNFIVMFLLVAIAFGLVMLLHSIAPEHEVGGAIVYDKPVQTTEITQAIPEPPVADVEPKEYPGYYCGSHDCGLRVDTNPISAPANDKGNVSEPSDMPTPWVIIPSLPTSHFAKPRLSKQPKHKLHRHRQYEYVIIDNTKYYPMMK